MKILKLDIKGFRSLKNISWTPGDLNVVIGPNGTGKSNLLRMLELISVSAKGGLGKYIQSSGGMGSLVWDGASDSIDFKVVVSPSDPNKDSNWVSVTYEIKMARLGKSSALRVESEFLEIIAERFGDEPCKLLGRLGSDAKVFDERKNVVVAAKESISEEETLLSLAAGPFTNNRYIPAFQKHLAAWSVYHDLRVDKDAVIRQSAIARSEKRVDPDGQNLISVLHTLYTGDRNFKKDINEAMRAAFGDDFEELIFPPAADQRVQLRVRWKSLQREQSAADLSDGTLRFLFLLTVLASPDPAPVIAIDEPEIGLHPSMLPIVAEYAIDAASRTQVIITTHSPQLLDAFRETIPVTTTANWHDGETSLKVLNGDELEGWLKNYSLGSLFLSGELEEME